jgi:hypothetical protein
VTTYREEPPRELTISNASRLRYVGEPKLGVWVSTTGVAPTGKYRVACLDNGSPLMYFPLRFSGHVVSVRPPLTLG